MSTLRRLAGELYRRDPALAIAGWAYLVALLVIAIGAPFDSRTILGLNPWIKPAKFLISIAVFLWSTGWLMFHLPGPRWVKAVIRWGVILSMSVEIGCISMQSLRGVRSHYNFDTPFDATVFGLMGGFIAFNSALIGVLWLLFLIRRTTLPAPYLWSIRLGLLLFLLASYQGVLLVTHGSHAVGVPDGGPGLPFVNWSTEAGDLRIAHFLGLHAMQIVPLVGWWLSTRLRGRPAGRATLLVVVFAVLYGAVGLLLYVRAMAGLSLWPAA